MPLPPVPAFRPVANPSAVVTAGNVRFAVLTGRLIRLEHSADGNFEDRPSQAFWYRDLPVPAFRKAVTSSSVEIETDYLLLRYTPDRRGFTSRTLSIRLKETGFTWKYGAAQKDNLKGTARTLDNAIGGILLEDGLLSRSGWAVVDDSDSLVFNEAGWLKPRNSGTDLYFFGYGMDCAACLYDFTRVAGPIPMIPRYILGNWWSRYWPYTAEELKALMEEFRAHEIPLSVCIVDMDWHVTKTGKLRNNGWTGYTWNRALFPDPEGFIRWLHEQGLRTALNLHPARGVWSHEEQYREMAEWMGVDPASKRPIPFDSADARFMEGYFEILHHPYEKAGIDFWWLDWQQGKTSKVGGLDPLSMLNHLHYFDLGRDGRKRPFVFSRWGGLGNHRYPIGFSGDTIIRWSALAFQPYFTATAANVGYGWWSHDIGGHMFWDGSPELYLRWVQFGVFSPIFRLHSTKIGRPDRRPWAKPDRYCQAARAAMQLRHALIPYIYSMAWRAHCTGISPITPMYYGNMKEAAAYDARDQYFFGSELVVAPVIQPADKPTGLATRRVWLPPGTWYNFFTGERFAGGEWHEIRTSLEDIPVYARAGAIVPIAPLRGWGGIDNPSELEVYVFPGEDNSFELYEDDGETTDYLRGKYAVTRFSLQDGCLTVHPATGDSSVLPGSRTYRVHLRGANAARTGAEPVAQFVITPRESRTVAIPPSLG